MAGIPINYVWTDFAGTKDPEYLKKHPLGRIPILETP
jgi:glutathione S-transferase